MRDIKLEVLLAADMGPTVYERDGSWWWADECWDEHGPCSSRESATSRQSVYIMHCLEGTADDARVPVSAQEWQAAKDGEREDGVHPCDNSAVWDCMCSGACSCHWATP